MFASSKFLNSNLSSLLSKILLPKKGRHQVISVINSSAVMHSNKAGSKKSPKFYFSTVVAIIMDY